MKKMNLKTIGTVRERERERERERGNLNNLMSNTAITLVALIITIIILLILAGITLNMIMGENGIINKAIIARDKTNQSQEDEEEKLKQLEKELETLGNESGNSKKVQIINKEGETVEITSENLKDYLGEEVKYENTDGTSVGGKTWRIFYVDFAGEYGEVGRIYLKADWTANDFTPDTVLSSYTLGTTKAYYKTYADMNPDWALYRLTSDSSISSWNSNEKAAAYLCDPSKWTQYVSNKAAYNGLNIFAIGGPSAEMFCKSYNIADSKTESSQYKAVYSESNSPGYKYSMDNGSSWNVVISNDTILPSVGKGMYLDKKGNSGDNLYHNYWLTSPSASSLISLCLMFGANGSLDQEFFNNSYAVCPLVSLPSGIIVEIK